MAVDEAEEFRVLRARAEHLAQITALAASRSLDKAKPAQAQRDGFLVSGYTEETYRGRLETAEHFYVAVQGSEVLGFLLAYSDERIEPDEWLNRRIKSALGSFVVIKQICVARDAARQGVASRLYYDVLEECAGQPVLAAVVAEPPNDASTRFHRRLGFEELTRLVPPDGRERVVWVHRRPRETLLYAQYGIAVDLYKHEDATNWQKLNNFFYITAALAAAIAFVFSKDGATSQQLAKSLALTIGAIGCGTALAFSQMLRFGRRYLQARKRAVVELEEHLAWHGGQRIVSNRAGIQRSGWLNASPTGMLMVLLPFLVAACWAAIILVVSIG